MKRQHLEAAEKLAPVVAPALRTAISHHMQLRQQQAQKEIQLDIAEQKQKMQQQATEQMQEIERGAAVKERERGEDNGENSVMRLMEKEDCDICKKMLRVIDGYSGEKREIALAEYGQLKGVMESADDDEEVRSFIEETDVLDETLDAAM
jgi:hypothetical protein